MSWLGFNTAASGMFSSQRKLYTVNHNVTNSERDGYSRQKVNSSATIPQHIPGQGYIGTGIGIDSVERVRDIYLDKKYRTESASLGQWDMKNYGLTQIEGVLRGSEEEGVNVDIDKLFSAIEDLSTDPTDMASRAAFRQSSLSLTKTLNETSSRLQKQQKDLNSEVKTKIRQVNDYADQIRSLNSEIFVMEVDGSNANDLRDQRDLIIDKLSEIVDIEAEERIVNVEESKDGKSIPIKKYEVRIGGISLVDHDMTKKLKYPPRTEDSTINGAEKLYIVEWQDGEPINLKGGELKGLLEVRDGSGPDSNGLPYYVERLNEFAKVFADNTNRIHIEGSNLNGNKTVPIFDVPDGVKPGYSEVKISLGSGDIDVTEALKNIAEEEKGKHNFTIKTPVKTEVETVYNDETNSNEEVSHRKGRVEDFTYLAVFKDGKLLGKLSEDGEKILSLDDDEVLYEVSDLKLNAESTEDFSIYKRTRRKIFADKDLTLVDNGVETPPNTGENLIKTDEEHTRESAYYEMFNTKEDKTGDFVIKPRIKDPDWNRGDLNNTVIKKSNKSDEKFKFDDDSFNATKDESGYVYANRDQYVDFIRDNVKADDIKVSKEIIDDLNNISTIGGDKDASDIENNDIMKELLASRENPKFFGDTEAYQGKPEDYLTSLLSTLGTDNQQAARMKTVEANIVKGAINQRLSVSGVRLDDEMADMVKFQQIFNASAKMISTFDQIYDTMINRLGMVGR